MTDINCPWCKSDRLVESSAIYATMIKVKNPGRRPLEVRVKVYTCLECEREFTEREAQSNGPGRTGSLPQE